MGQQREDIRAKCGRLGYDDVKKHLHDGTDFRNDKEAGWAREWLEDQDRLHRQEGREALTISMADQANMLTIQANKIADKAMRISWVSAIAAMVSAFIALIAVIMDKT